MRPFQRELEKEMVTLLFRDEHSRFLLPQVDPNHFFSDHYKVLVKSLKSFVDKFKGLPESRKLFRRFLFESEYLKEEDKEQYTLLLREIFTKELHPATSSYIRADLIKTLKQNAFYEIKERMGAMIDAGDFQGIIKLSRQASEIGVEHKGKLDMNRGLQQFMYDFADTAKKKGIPTGISKIDATFLSGYIPFGTYSLFLAPTNRGKTFWLCHQAALSYTMGFNTLYITLEDGDVGIGARIVPMVAGKGASTKDIIENPEVILSSITRKQVTAGELFVETYPGGKTNTDFIAQRVERLAEDGFEIDHLCIDYINCVAPSAYKPDKTHERLGLVSGELKAIAQQFDVRLDTAAQINREGSKKAIATLEDIAGSYEMTHHADVVYVLGQNDDAYKNKEATLTLEKNRIGSKKVVVPLQWNAETYTIKEKG